PPAAPDPSATRRVGRPRQAGRPRGSSRPKSRNRGSQIKEHRCDTPTSASAGRSSLSGSLIWAAQLLELGRGCRSAATETGPAPEGARPVTRELSSERGDLRGDRRLAVCRLVLVDDALAHSLVELLGGGGQSGLGLGLVARGDGLARATHGRLELALDSLVALFGLLVGADALDLRLDVRHGSLSLWNGW